MGKVGWCGLQKSPVTGKFSQPDNCNAIQYKSFSPLSVQWGTYFLCCVDVLTCERAIALDFFCVLEYSFLPLLWKSIPYEIDDHGFTY